jgi:hypothetical protein
MSLLVDARRSGRRCREDSCITRPLILERRLDATNEALIRLKTQLQRRQPRSVIEEADDRTEERLGTSGGNLVYAGYPYDPFA